LSDGCRRDVKIEKIGVVQTGGSPFRLKWLCSFLLDGSKSWEISRAPHIIKTHISSFQKNILQIGINGRTGHRGFFNPEQAYVLVHPIALQPVLNS
jgi:hypothetical protein